MSKKQRKRVSKRDTAVWLKYGVGGDAFEDPHDYTTMDVFDEPGRESFADTPKSIALLTQYAGKPPLDMWFETVAQPVSNNFDDWRNSFARPLAETHTVSVTADQLEDASASSESDDAMELSSFDEDVDLRRALHPNWQEFSAAQLADTSTKAFLGAAPRDCTDVDIVLLEMLMCAKRREGWDAVMRRLAAEHSAVESQTTAEAELRYYRFKHRDFYVALHLSLERDKPQLRNYFYLDVIS